MPSLSHSQEKILEADALRFRQEEPSAEGGELEYYRSKGLLAARELDMFRQRRVVQIMERLRNRNDAWNLIPSGFDRIKDDCMIFQQDMHGFVLQPSANLSRLPFVSYRINLDRPNLKGVLIAGIMDFPLFRGEMVVKIVGACDGENEAVECILPMTKLRDNAPTLFEFPAIANSHRQSLEVKIFARNTDGPVRIFEMRRYKWFGLGPIETRLFAGFVFG